MEWKIELETGGMETLQKKPVGNEEKITLERELLFCSSEKAKIEFLKDSFGYFRGCSIPLMNILFGNSKEKMDHSKIISKRYPPVSIQLKRVYGFCSFDRRDTVLYAHHLTDVDLTSENLSQYLQNPGNHNFDF